MRASKPAKARNAEMAKGEHKYSVSVQWTGNRGTGTSGYRDYGRDHVIRAGGKPDIAGSSDPAFRGDPGRWNPEDLLVGAVSACHKLWYLHLCSDAGIAVLAYDDRAEGTMVEDPEAGRFTRIVLRPRVTIRAADDVALAERLHHAAHEKCFIANSVNFPIVCEPEIERATASVAGER
jgi:organic hydroperoxide reductase OsmC/OhrA